MTKLTRKETWAIIFGLKCKESCPTVKPHNFCCHVCHLRGICAAPCYEDQCETALRIMEVEQDE